MISKKFRIDREFIPYILNKGETYKSQLFIVKYKPNSLDHHRFSTIVSLKIHSKAVKRNYLRRQIYEAIRINSKDLKPNQSLDLIFIPKKSILQEKYQQIEADIKSTLTKLS